MAWCTKVYVTVHIMDSAASEISVIPPSELICKKEVTRMHIEVSIKRTLTGFSVMGHSLIVKCYKTFNYTNTVRLPGAQHFSGYFRV